MQKQNISSTVSNEKKRSKGGAYINQLSLTVVEKCAAVSQNEHSASRILQHGIIDF